MKRLPSVAGLVIVSALAVAFSCSDAAPQKEFDGQAAYRYVEQQVVFGPRIPGTEPHRRMGDWLDSLLKARADTVIVQSWNHVTLKGDTLPLRNFLARFNPAAAKRVLYLAHWDTKPASGRDEQLDYSKPIAGANDGASGVAVLLGVADALKAHPLAPDVGVDLLFVDGEDYGIFSEKSDVLIGTQYYVDHRPPGGAPLFAVLFDMVGDKDLKIPPESYSSIGAPEVVDRFWTMAEELGYSAYFPRADGGAVEDDHIPLQKAGISAIDVIDFSYGPANSYWHGPGDTVDHVSAESLKIVGDVAVAVLRALK
jgi:glutaminyl-peptide cyclotransferase